MSTQDYRTTLRRELVTRCQRNPKYSLRAFARDLKVEPARLSDILNGKKGLSRTAAAALGKRLGMSARELETFCDQVDSLHARSRTARKLAAQRLKDQGESLSAQELTLDVFRAVSDWHHLALLQLLKIPGAASDTKWLSEALGLRPLVVEEALERLARLNLVETRDGKVRTTHDTVLSPDGIPSEAIKKFHEQTLQKCLAALFSQPVRERDYFTTYLPVDRRDIDDVRRKVREFHQSIVRDFAGKSSVNRVYSLSCQFISLTPHIQEKKT